MNVDAAASDRLAAVLSPPLTWFELFYDLVFVASVMIFSNAFSRNPTWENAAWVAAVFAAVWFMWLLTVLSFSQFAHDDRRHRGLILTQMFLVTLVAVSAGDGVAEHEAWVGCLAALLALITALIYVRAATASARGTAAPHGHESVEGRTDEAPASAVAAGDGAGTTTDPPAAAPTSESPPTASRAESQVRLQVARRVIGATVGAAVLFALGGLEGGVLAYVLGAVALALLGVTAVAVASVRHPDFPGLDHEHLTERLGAFTIIMCGESFVKVAITAADGTLDGIDIWVMAFEFALVFSVWWAYFDDIPNAGVPAAGPRRTGWVALHLVLHLGLMGVAVGASKYIVAATEQHLSVKQLITLALPLGVVYLSLAGIGGLSPRPSTGWLTVLRVTTAALIGLVAFTWWELHPAGAEGLLGSLAAIAFVAATTSSRLMLPAGRRDEVPELAEP